MEFKYRIDRHSFDIYACGSCGMQMQHPLPREANAYYDEDYYTGQADFSYEDERLSEQYDAIVHRARLGMLRRYLARAYSGPQDRFLDVGCAFGAFVRSAAVSFTAAGLDVSAFAVRAGNQISRDRNLETELFEGDLLHLPKSNIGRRNFFEPESLTAITMVEVAEHLEKPRESFAAAFKLLKPGGILLIQTANFEGLQAMRQGADYNYYLPGHLHYFTATGLRRLLGSVGFTEFHEFMPVDFSLWAKWRKSWGKVPARRYVQVLVKMSYYHLKSKLKFDGRPATSSYVLYARK
jgi:SAM-dependent methyltransferase